MYPTPIIERAFELARSGQFLTIWELKAKLKAERYAYVDAALVGRSLQRQLKDLIRSEGERDHYCSKILDENGGAKIGLTGLI